MFDCLEYFVVIPIEVISYYVGTIAIVRFCVATLFYEINGYYERSIKVLSLNTDNYINNYWLLKYNLK